MLFKIFGKIIMNIQIFFFRLTNGKLFSGMGKMPTMVLNTIGRKSRKRRTNMVMYLRDGDAFIITASNSGNKHHPGWLYNIMDSPKEVNIEVPGRKLNVTAKIASEIERKKYWPELIEKAPFFDGYRKRADREIQMVILQPQE